MNILILVLKITGIILAVIIVLLILLLFVPFSYRSEGTFDENKSAFIKVHSFLWIVGARVSYEDKKAGYKVRLFGIPIIKGNLIGGDGPDEDEDNQEELFQPKKKKRRLFGKKEEEVADGVDAVNHREYLPSVTEADAEEEKKRGVMPVIKKVFSVIGTVLKKIWEAFVKVGGILLSIPGRINDFLGLEAKLKDKYKKIKRLYKSKGFKRALVYTKELIFKIIKHIKPKKAEAYLKAGFESPDKTGQMVGVLSMLYGMNYFKREKFVVEPDFENKVLAGYYKIRGRFVVGYLIIIVLKFYYRREVRFVVKQFKRIKAS